MSIILPKIQSFFDKGFLPGGGDLDVARSFDLKSRGEVSLNCISTVEGIATSLLHPAKGGLTVMLEERVGGGGILDQALQANKDAIKDKQATIAASLPASMAGIAALAARHDILKKDPNFIKAIAQKTHMTALFVLNIELGPDENISLDGCKEVGRPQISPDKIALVLISEKIIGNSDFPKILPIPSISKAVNFCYKDERGDPQIIQELGPIDIPNYQKALEDLPVVHNRNLQQNPIYTHMTRL